MKTTHIKETELDEFESGSFWTTTHNMTNVEISIALHTRDDNTRLTVVTIEGWNENFEIVKHRFFVEGHEFPKINAQTV